MSSGEPITEKTIQDLVAANKELVKDLGPGGRVWELVKIVLPIVLTLVLGYWIWQRQNKTQTQVDENTQMLQARLVLSEEFYKRKLAVYEDAAKDIARLRQALERLADQAIDPAVSTAAADSIRAIDDLRRSDLLYMSEDLKQELTQLWGLGMTRMQVGGEDGPETTAAMQKVDDEVTTLERRMKDDLQTQSLAFPQAASPPARPGTP